jgi:hypothetical protein
LLSSADSTKAAKSIDLLKNLPAGAITPNFAQELLSIGLGKWSEIDPRAASDFLLHYGDRGSLNIVVNEEVGRNWAKQDPMAALAWKGQQIGADFQQNIALGIFQNWVSRQPDQAIQYAREHLSDG